MPSQPGKDNGAMSNPIESGAAAGIIRTVGKWQVPALGAGTWALGGRWEFGGAPAGWGDVDDEVSIAAIRAAYEGGVRLFDTADAYGCGHAERIVGKAVAPFRDDVVIATKVGLVFDEATRTGEGIDISPAYIRRACEASLRRLGTEDIDLYQLHPGEVTADQASPVVEVFDQLVAEGKVRSYGTANEAVDVIDVFATGAGCVAVQQQLNVFGANDEALARCDTYDLAVLARSPLAMGFLSGKYRSRDQLVAGDVRRETPHWDYFTEAGMPHWQERLAAIRDELCTGGRTLVQGALAYVWGRSNRAIALGGIRTPEQAKEQAGALAHGPLTPAQLAHIDELLAAA
jgi:aryl-alcohol dehydrogenase-like predicted oxidoreductase